MRSKALFLALVGAATVAAPLAVTGNATAGTNPNITEVQFRILSPSSLALSGQFPVQVDAKVPYGEVCSFDVWKTDVQGNVESYEGHHYGSGPDLLWTDNAVSTAGTGYTRYQVQAQDCSGNSGNTVLSNAYYPVKNDDDATFESCDTDTCNGYVPYLRVVSGTSKRVSVAKAFGGSYTQTTSGVGTTATYSTECYSNNLALGIYGSTGPMGGIASVSINGRSKPNISFYSSSTKYRKLLATYATSDIANKTITLKVIRKGAGGGAAMNLDASTELRTDGSMTCH